MPLTPPQLRAILTRVAMLGGAEKVGRVLSEVKGATVMGPRLARAVKYGVNPQQQRNRYFQALGYAIAQGHAEATDAGVARDFAEDNFGFADWNGKRCAPARLALGAQGSRERLLRTIDARLARIGLRRGQQSI